MPSRFRLALVLASLVTAAACGSLYSSSPTPAPTPTPGAPGNDGTGTAISIPSGAENLGNRAFPPNPLTVDPGTTVTWTNTDNVAHTSTSDVAGWDSGLIQPGAAFSQSFATSGTYHFHCQVHPSMVGTVIVR